LKSRERFVLGQHRESVIRALVVVAAGSLAGCASIVSGSNQSVSVETRLEGGSPVSGANCKLANNKGTWFVTTPGSVVVQRSFEELSVRCERDQHEPASLMVKSTTKGMAFGNILFGGIIGAGVDMSTGAAYDYPAVITVSMLPRAAALAPAAAAAPASTTAPAAAAAPASNTPPAAAPSPATPAPAAAPLPASAPAAATAAPKS
jgi:hypothetical protein